ncbi:MAG: hypothetical protein LQ343_005867 [Gyalolechia ehrenbergii]|nr:MAG: hypothetical protein LQ343_005867 [Gyalolechia ehrenbergii]
MSNPSRDDQLATTETIYDEPSSSNHTNDSAAYAENHVTEDLHPAFAEAGIGFDTSNDCFAAKCDEVYDETALIDSEKAFTDALEQFQQGVKPKYKSQIDLRETHSWDEVMQYANEARDKYTGVDKKGIAKKINNRLRTFQTAAPGIQAWLKLLPSTSTYGSVVCGGFTIILEAAVRLRQLRKETVNALDQIPLCIEKAEFFMRVYGYPQVNKQVATLGINAQQDVSVQSLYKSMRPIPHPFPGKYKSAVWRGPAYEEAMKKKMKKIETASQAMSDRADEEKQDRLKVIRDTTEYTKDQVGELKILAVEARDHLYKVLKDTEFWQEALQSWKESRMAKEARRASRDQADLEHEEENRAARKSLLARFGSNYIDPSRDMETVLGQITSMILGDQDRVEAVIQPMLDWLLNPTHEGLLIHGNGRRHDAISPTSVACALLVHVFSKELYFPTLWVGHTRRKEASEAFREVASTFIRWASGCVCAGWCFLLRKPTPSRQHRQDHRGISKLCKVRPDDFYPVTYEPTQDEPHFTPARDSTVSHRDGDPRPCQWSQTGAQQSPHHVVYREESKKIVRKLEKSEEVQIVGK